MRFPWVKTQNKYIFKTILSEGLKVNTFCSYLKEPQVLKVKVTSLSGDYINIKPKGYESIDSEPENTVFVFNFGPCKTMTGIF